jgi:hypothetical protein
MSNPYTIEALAADYAENHDKFPYKDEWGEHLIKPLARLMHEKGIRHLAITMENGKATFLLETHETSPANADEHTTPRKTTTDET